MEELFEKLLAADILTEDTKAELEAAFKGKLDEAVAQARTDATAAVTAELNEQWISAREALIEALDVSMTEALKSELSELHADIASYRDEKVVYENKLVSAKKQMAESLKSDMAQLINELDTWLDIRLTAELSELSEDLQVVKQQQFGKSVFEAFVKEFQQFYVDDGSTQRELAKKTAGLSQATKSLTEAQKQIAQLERSIKMTEVLSPLTGRAREVMEAILKNIETKNLSEAFNTYIGRVVKETAMPTSEKETPVLAEGTKAPTGAIKTGDDKQRITESATLKTAEVANDVKTSNAIDPDELLRLRRAAGLV